MGERKSDKEPVEFKPLICVCPYCGHKTNNIVCDKCGRNTSS